MSNRTKPILTFLLCAAIIGCFGCTSTTPKAAPSQATMTVHGTLHDGTVVRRTVTVDVPQTRKQRPTWKCKVARAMGASIMIYYNPAIAAVYVAEAMK